MLLGQDTVSLVALGLRLLLGGCAEAHRSESCETARFFERWPGRYACGEVFDDGWDPDPYELLPWKKVSAARSLDKCRVLYPAGTGTQSLADALAAYRKDKDWEERAGHDHARTASRDVSHHIMSLRVARRPPPSRGARPEFAARAGETPWTAWSPGGGPLPRGPRRRSAMRP